MLCTSSVPSAFRLSVQRFAAYILFTKSVLCASFRCAKESEIGFQLESNESHTLIFPDKY